MEARASNIFSEIIAFERANQQLNKKLETAESESRRVVAVIPAYNEERFIGSVVLKTLQYVDEVFVVDDGSKDATAEIAELAGAIVVRQENAGKGVALNTGFKKAMELILPAVIVTMDGDWQHMPVEIPRVIEPILKGEADMVVGSRYLEQTSDVPKQRVLGHWFFTTLTNTVSGTNLTDSQSGFRAFSLEAARRIDFDSAGFSVESEQQFIAKDHGLRVVEVPITILYHDKPKRNVMKQGFEVLNGILRLVGQHRPLLFFTSLGLGSLLLGLLMWIAVINSYNNNEELAVETALVALLLSIAGTVALFTGIILHSLRGLIIDFVQPAAERRF